MLYHLIQPFVPLIHKNIIFSLTFFQNPRMNFEFFIDMNVILVQIVILIGGKGSRIHQVEKCCSKYLACTPKILIRFRFLYNPSN